MEQYKRGVWTPWAKVVCYECHGNENLPNPKTEEEWAKITQPQELKYGNAVTFCDDCHEPVQLDESVAREHNLVLDLRECGFDAHMAQTGGMMSACSIEPSDQIKGEGGPDDVGEILVTFDDGGDGLYWMGAYDNDCSTLDPEWAGVSFKSHDEVILHVCRHQEKFAKLEQPEPKWPEFLKKPARETTLADLMAEAKERASDKGAIREGRKPPGAHDLER